MESPIHHKKKDTSAWKQKVPRSISGIYKLSNWTEPKINNLRQVIPDR
jgi:hypothetical protein